MFTAQDKEIKNFNGTTVERMCLESIIGHYRPWNWKVVDNGIIIENTHGLFKLSIKAVELDTNVKSEK